MTGELTMSQRTWFITGVSSGFGRQLTDQLLRRGDRVIGTVRDTSKVTDLLKLYPEAFHAEVLTKEQVEHITATNLLGPIHLIRAALPHLRAQGAGRVIQVSSYGGQVAFPGNSMYHATKWGIEGFVE